MYHRLLNFEWSTNVIAGSKFRNEIAKQGHVYRMYLNGETEMISRELSAQQRGLRE